MVFRAMEGKKEISGCAGVRIWERAEFWLFVKFLSEMKIKFGKFPFFLFYHEKLHFVKYLTVSKKSLQNNTSFKKSPGSAAFDIYISNASVKGDYTKNWLAQVHSCSLFCTAYFNS